MSNIIRDLNDRNGRPNEKGYHDSTMPLGNQPGHVGKPASKGMFTGSGGDVYKAGLQESQKLDMLLGRGR